jgi:hypothetical protein
MIKIFFIAVVTWVLWGKVSTWLALHKKITASEKWKTTEGELVDYQSTQKKGKLARFQNSFTHHCYVQYGISGKKFGCQRISFHAPSHNLNHDYLNDLVSREKDTVTVWFDENNPGDSVLLNPRHHRKALSSIGMLVFATISVAMIVMAIIS